MERSEVVVRRLTGVDDDTWFPFIRCLAWKLEKRPREGDPPDDWAGPDVTAPFVSFPVAGEIDTARQTVIDIAATCTDPPWIVPLAIADIGP